MEAAVAVVHRGVSFVSSPAAVHEGHWKYPASGPNTFQLLSSSSSSSSSASCLSYSSRRTHRGERRALRSTSDSEETARGELSAILEVDGVLVDSYRVGNREAFNRAFRNPGQDCAKWTEPIYDDLVSFLHKKSDGDEEMMLGLYFNHIGWSSSLPTSEKSAFVKGMLQAKVYPCTNASLKNAMDEFMMSKDLPFHRGVQEFIDEACEGGILVAILTAYSKCGEKVARFTIERLGEERMPKVKIVGWKDVEQSLYGQLVFSKGMLSGLDEQLSEEVRKAASVERQRIADEVASLLKMRVKLDTSSPESLDRIVDALRATAEFVWAPVSNCILIAGSLAGVYGSDKLECHVSSYGNSFTSRVEIPSSSTVVMDGFGEPDLTMSSLQHRNWP